MNEETREELAALAALDLLTAEEAAEFRAALAADPALQQTVDDFIESAAALAYESPFTKAPPGVLARVLAEARGGQPAPVLRSRFGFLPWAMAAGFAAAATIFYAKCARLERTADDLRQRHEAARIEMAAGVEEERKQAATKLVIATSERDFLQKQAAILENRDALAQVRIATLKSQVAAFEKVLAVAVWDAEKQTGVVKLDNLPAAGAGRDYQLWIIDPKNPAPVNAGVVAVNAGGVARMSFKPDRPISVADKFALSLERAGGAPAPQGPIVLLSN